MEREGDGALRMVAIYRRTVGLYETARGRPGWTVQGEQMLEGLRGALEYFEEELRCQQGSNFEEKEVLYA